MSKKYIYIFINLKFVKLSKYITAVSLLLVSSNLWLLTEVKAEIKDILESNTKNMYTKVWIISVLFFQVLLVAQ